MYIQTLSDIYELVADPGIRPAILDIAWLGTQTHSRGFLVIHSDPADPEQVRIRFIPYDLTLTHEFQAGIRQHMTHEHLAHLMALLNGYNPHANIVVLCIIRKNPATPAPNTHLIASLLVNC